MPFNVAEEIGVAEFGNQYSRSPISESPDGRFVSVVTERGLLRQNRVLDELRVYSRGALREYVLSDEKRRAPAPVVDLDEATYREGPVISQICWLSDSSGIAFLLKTGSGDKELVLEHLETKRAQVLSLRNQDVVAFAIADATHYAYTVRSSAHASAIGGPAEPAATVGTGVPLLELLLPGQIKHDLLAALGPTAGRSVLWGANGGTPHLIVSATTGAPIVLYLPGQRALALSSDRHTLSTAVPLAEVPSAWEQRYRAPLPNDPHSIRAGRQNLDAEFGADYVSQYVTVNLRTGTVTPINRAPTAWSAGWLGAAMARATWSANGRDLLLPGAFVEPKQKGHPAGRPCVAVFRLATDTVQCVAPLSSFVMSKRNGEAGQYSITDLSFGFGVDNRVIEETKRYGKYGPLEGTGVQVFERRLGIWTPASPGAATQKSAETMELRIAQGLNRPPVLMAAIPDMRVSRVVWNPNPELKGFALGVASIYRWEDGLGGAWIGALYRPPNYTQGRRYPLVIQTHGFLEKEFRPSGIYPTAFAARALANAGIMVLQIANYPTGLTPGFADRYVAGYESAALQLASAGMVDIHRVGIIGFSYSVYTVLEALTTVKFRFAAASVTDGIDVGYWQYLMSVDEDKNAIANEADRLIGAAPFDGGLRVWFERSPGFNMRNVHTPLSVVALGRGNLLFMWEPYAALRYLDRPVDLLLLDSNEHVLTNPAARMASQGGSVDWFRFWLQGYESRSPAKASQYRRWEDLCDMQREENPGWPTFCIARRHDESQVTN